MGIVRFCLAVAGMIAGVAIASPAIAISFEVIDTTFSVAMDERHRRPIAPLDPSGYCETAANAASPIPILDSRLHRDIYFWTRIKADQSANLIYKWYQNDSPVRQYQTEYTWYDRILILVRELEIDAGWQEVARIVLRIAPSPNWRTWSRKEIDPNIHVGDWKVEISTSVEPNNILCLARFRVE